MILINPIKGELLFRRELNPKFTGIDLETFFERVKDVYKNLSTDSQVIEPENSLIMEFAQLTSNEPYCDDAVSALPYMIRTNVCVDNGKFSKAMYNSGHFKDDLSNDIFCNTYRGNNVFLGLNRSIAYSMDIQAAPTMINYWLDPQLAYFYILSGELEIGDIYFKRNHVGLGTVKKFHGYSELNTIREIQGINSDIASQLTYVEKYMEDLKLYLETPMSTLSDDEVNEYTGVIKILIKHSAGEIGRGECKASARDSYLYLLKCWINLLDNTQRHLVIQRPKIVGKLKPKLRIVEDEPKESAFYMAGSKLN